MRFRRSIVYRELAHRAAVRVQRDGHGYSRTWNS